MPWSIPEIEQKTYAHNPLGLVVAQLRFHSVLKMPRLKDEFQDIVRNDFPVFEEKLISSVAFNPQTEKILRGEERSFSFKDVPGTTALALANDALAIETSAYEHHESFLGAFQKAVEALLNVCSDIQPKRLGLRYVNVIKKTEIAEAGRDVAWEDLVSAELLGVPGAAGLQDSTFRAVITAPIDPGAMSLRHGLVREEDKPAEYQIDIDRYLVGQFKVQRTSELLTRFTDDCFGLFRLCIADGLEQWMMEPKPNRREVADA